LFCAVWRSRWTSRPFAPGQRFRFIKLTDAQAAKSNGSDWPGADIDAVGAINTLPVSGETGQ
jgi:hypothetical protein